MAKCLHVDKKIILVKPLSLGKTFTFQQNLYMFKTKLLPFGKNSNFFLAKPISRDKNFISSWLNHYTLAKVLFILV